MEKIKEIKDAMSCLNKAKNNEPIFVLRAQDKLAPLLVRMWCELAEFHGCFEDKVNEAWGLSKKMKIWARTNKTKFPD